MLRRVKMHFVHYETVARTSFEEGPSVKPRTRSHSQKAKRTRPHASHESLALWKCNEVGDGTHSHVDKKGTHSVLVPCTFLAAPPDPWREIGGSHLSWSEPCCSSEACGGIPVGPSERKCSVSSPCTCSLWEKRQKGKISIPTLTRAYASSQNTSCYLVHAQVSLASHAKLENSATQWVSHRWTTFQAPSQQGNAKHVTAAQVKSVQY